MIYLSSIEGWSILLPSSDFFSISYKLSSLTLLLELRILCFPYKDQHIETSQLPGRLSAGSRYLYWWYIDDEILLFGLQIMDHCQMKKVDTSRHYGCRAGCQPDLNIDIDDSELCYLGFSIKSWISANWKRSTHRDITVAGPLSGGSGLITHWWSTSFVNTWMSQSNHGSLPNENESVWLYCRNHENNWKGIKLISAA